jgi:hypothetical protein
MERDPFAKFQARFIRNDREFLSQEELAAIEAKEFKILRLQWAKDLLVFFLEVIIQYSPSIPMEMFSFFRLITSQYACWLCTPTPSGVGQVISGATFFRPTVGAGAFRTGFLTCANAGTAIARATRHAEALRIPSV